MESCEEKIRLVILRYLERLLEPKIIEEANLAQITKTLEMLLENAAAFPVGQAGEEDAVTQGLRELAREMGASRCEE